VFFLKKVLLNVLLNQKFIEIFDRYLGLIKKNLKIFSGLEFDNLILFEIKVTNGSIAKGISVYLLFVR
jgi:hypothetical protein